MGIALIARGASQISQFVRNGIAFQQWVRNVRASGGKAVLCSGGREDVRLEEILVDQRAPILKAYLQAAAGARPHVPVDKDAPLAEFEKMAATIPIFRLGSNPKR